MGSTSLSASSDPADRSPDDLASLRQTLLRWYAREGRVLPWRRPPGEPADPYAVWVSEVMLQQTQAATVLPYYERWMARLPRLADLAAAPLDTVLELWQGLGYYGRARRLWQAARQLQAAGKGVPDRFEELRALPGVGDYTAAAVLSIAFGQARPAIDGNLRRVLGRIGALEGDLTRGAGARRLRELAERLLEAAPAADGAPEKDPDGAIARAARATPGDLNQALMDLGALVCRPQNPECPRCPVQAFCRAWTLGRTAEFPAPPPRTTPRAAKGLAYAIQDEAGRWLVGRRRPEGLLGGLWELPWSASGPAETSASLAAATSDVSDALAPTASRHATTAADRSDAVGPYRPSGLATLQPMDGPPLTHTFTHLRLELRLLRGRTQRKPTPDGGAARGETAASPDAAGLIFDLGHLSSETYEAWRWVNADELATLPRSRLMDKLWQRVLEA